MIKIILYPTIPLEPVGSPAQEEELLKAGKVPLSIVLPTYNESQNITKMLDLIAETLPADTAA